MREEQNFYRQMKLIENKCYDEIIRLMLEMDVTSLDISEENENCDEVSVLVYDDIDGGASKVVINKVCLVLLPTNTYEVILVNDCDEEVNKSDMTDCNIIYVYEAVYGRYREMMNNAMDSE